MRERERDVSTCIIHVMYVYIYTKAYRHVSKIEIICVYVKTYMNIHEHTCIHVYTYIRTHLHIQLYMHIQAKILSNIVLNVQLGPIML